jgi:hypothetical protein
MVIGSSFDVNLRGRKIDAKEDKNLLMLRSMQPRD